MPKEKEKLAVPQAASSKKIAPRKRILTAEGWKRMQAIKRAPSKKTASGKQS